MILQPIQKFLSRIIIRYIEKPVLNYRPNQFIPLSELEDCLQPGDILLVEGNQRISTAIKYLTQSTWSHAALYVGKEPKLKDKYGHTATLIEADVKDGSIAVSLTKYLGFNTRICRPQLITDEDRDAVIEFMIASIGMKYDIKNVIDLPKATLIARAFQHVRYPILPDITRENQKEIMSIRHHSLYTPRDFDVSPYFGIIKPTILKNPDYKKFNWRDRNSNPEQG